MVGDRFQGETMSEYISIAYGNGLEPHAVDPTVEAVTRPIADEPLVLPAPTPRIQTDVNITGAFIDTMA